MIKKKSHRSALFCTKHPNRDKKKGAQTSALPKLNLQFLVLNPYFLIRIEPLEPSPHLLQQQNMDEW